jgi:hypothetical protein
MIPGGCRAGAVNESVWSEVNSDKAVRTIAEERIKTGGERRVPLSDPCRGIFAEPERSQVERRCSVARDLRERRANIKSQAENSMEEALQSLAPDIILHGCHTSFRIWVVERAAFLGDGRQSAPTPRKPIGALICLMAHWPAHCSKHEPKSPAADVIPFPERMSRRMAGSPLDEN